jgi:hypothetical protein
MKQPVVAVIASAILALSSVAASAMPFASNLGNAEQGTILVKGGHGHGGHGHGHGYGHGHGRHLGWTIGRHRGWSHSHHHLHY